MGAFPWNCWKKPRDRYEASKWDAFHWREPTPLTVALRKEVALAAKLRANPLPTPYWLAGPTKATLSGISKGLDWTRETVYDVVGEGESSEVVHYENCTEWLKARRAARGLEG